MKMIRNPLVLVFLDIWHMGGYVVDLSSKGNAASRCACIYIRIKEPTQDVNPMDHEPNVIFIQKRSQRASPPSCACSKRWWHEYAGRPIQPLLQHLLMQVILIVLVVMDALNKPSTPSSHTSFTTPPPRALSSNSSLARVRSPVSLFHTQPSFSQHPRQPRAQLFVRRQDTLPFWLGWNGLLFTFCWKWFALLFIAVEIGRQALVDVLLGSWSCRFCTLSIPTFC